MTQDGHSDAADELVPLTRERRKGGTYTRRPELEKEIRAAVDRPLLELISGTPPASSSCLLYFVRNYRPNGSSSVQEKILMELLNRIDRQVIRGTRGLVGDWRTKVRLDVRDWFLEQIYGRSDRLDVYEFAFSKALKARIIDSIRKYQTREQTEVAEGSFEKDDRDGPDTIDALNYRYAGPTMTSAEAALELEKVLSVLTEQERKVIYATEAYGLDQGEVGELIGVGTRRVRQILSKAMEKIEAYKRKGDA